MAELNGIVRGKINRIADQQIDANKLYNITDIQGISLTNAQMTAAISPEQEGLFKNKDIYFCTDEGTYKKDTFYKFVINYAEGSADWEEIQMGGGGEPIAEAIRDNTTEIVSNSPAGTFKAGGTSFVGANAKFAVAIGRNVSIESAYNVAIGSNAQARGNADIALGYYANAGYQGYNKIAIGNQAQAETTRTIAIGYGAKSNASAAIQLGNGTNSSANTFQIGNDNIYNFDTHTLTVQNLSDGETTKTMTEVLAGGGGSASAAKYMHNVMANATTQAGTWRYQLELENSQAEAYTQIGQVGHYLYQLNNGVRIPCTGMCTLGSDKYIITAVKATSTDNMVAFEMYNILTGEFKDDMTTGAVEVTDVVS